MSGPQSLVPIGPLDALIRSALVPAASIKAQPRVLVFNGGRSMTRSDALRRQANTPRKKRIVENQKLGSSDGVIYTASHVTGNTFTLQRAEPKRRGKAARKAAKRARQRQAHKESSCIIFESHD